MQAYKAKVSLSKILEELKSLEFQKDDGQIEMAVNQSEGIPARIRSLPAIMAAIAEIEQLRGQKAIGMMLNRLEPNAIVPEHRDWVPATEKLGESPCLERWHLAIQTNDKCYWQDKYNKILVQAGDWMGPMPYWLEHKVINNGDVDRIHLVVDLDSPNPVGEYEH